MTTIRYLVKPTYYIQPNGNRNKVYLVYDLQQPTVSTGRQLHHSWSFPCKETMEEFFAQKGIPTHNWQRGPSQFLYKNLTTLPLQMMA